MSYGNRSFSRSTCENQKGIEYQTYHLLGACFLLSVHNGRTVTFLQKTDLPENNDCDVAYERSDGRR